MSPASASASETVSPGGEPTQFIATNGYPSAYIEAGTTNPALLLVHGSISDYRVWIQQVGAFSERYRTLAVSLRHCYPERWNGTGNDFTVEQHADDLADFVARKGLGCVNVLGHSRGGAVALQLALQRADLVRTLVLADPGGLESLLHDTSDNTHLGRETERMFARLRDDLSTKDPETAAGNFVDALGGTGTWARRSTEQRQIVLDNIQTGPACAQRPRFTRAQISSLDVPMLLVTGARSPPRYARILNAMADANSRVAGIVTIEGAAHAMNRENPAAFNAAVLEFLARR